MLKWRLVTGTTVAAVVASVLFLLPAWTHMILLLAVFLLAQIEFFEMVRNSGHRYELAATTVCGIALLLVTALESPVVLSVSKVYLGWVPPAQDRLDLTGWVLSLTPAVLLVCGVLRRRTEKAMETFALSYAGFWYVAVLLSFIVRLAYEWPIYRNFHTNYTGRLMLLLFVLLVKSGDIGGYTFGRIWGRHKLIPKISPGKTVEGLVGCYVFSLAVGLGAWALFHYRYGDWLGQTRLSLADGFALPLLLTTTGVLGDLAESLIKRSVNVKDSSSRFPGMGGILDILDSLLFSAPFMYFYVLLFLK